MHFKTNRQELLCAALLMSIGAAAAWGGTHYTIGTLGRMGPGFFPVALGCTLMLLALLMVFTPVSAEDEEAGEAEPANTRAWAFITAGVVSFIVLGSMTGLVPGTFFLVLLAAMGDRGNSKRACVLVAVGVTVLAVVLFRLLLQIQIPLFTWM
ncbi:Tripartite tricarboxylate transporter TctB family protein [Oryzisolibacter propanilivorax]|uniref:Tripartite tricarboxylate transporter TctB family protein n=1 Tax=Oryzisolibacter propanilivorax TaxID=1527607 RepID=A0A1G9VDR9_9BURK|nr:tripartite tricarboxylate transporter TctB family protein [Oryzisolibacter propanilivorax]SDM70230.1 Tripartite tricarboxylate transporter TctB family protein [Oryzisolibacter propanilivorax]